ncbi:defensin-B5-like [Dermochelys coriacea]|uniref:defensin-B5-like n=1 Tax=Dermochelys coriacea TaxID=27794 RepID=UPI0018E81EBE|nr:defensin-B5-like [Dermochelys coriacea]
MKILYLLFAVVFLVLHVQGQHQQEPQDDPQAWNEAPDDAEEEAEAEMAPGPDKQQRYIVCSFEGGMCRSKKCKQWEKKIGTCTQQDPCCVKRSWKELLG